MNQNNDDIIKIIICTHKTCRLPHDTVFIPVQTGAALCGKELQLQGYNFMRDDYGENISLKNKSFCEMTAIYWTWKNIKNFFPNLKYIGVNHYRRYFAFDKRESFVDLYEKPESDIERYLIDDKSVLNVLEKYDAIIPRKTYYPCSLELFYGYKHKKEDFDVMKSIVLEFSPEYENAFNKVLIQGNTMHNYNMFILRYDQFEFYCEWVFPILLEIEKQIDIHDYDDVQCRVFGYMAERLFNVWLYHNRLHFKEIPVYKYTNGKRVPTALRFASILQREGSFLGKQLLNLHK